MAHLKTFALCIHRLLPFPLGPQSEFSILPMSISNGNLSVLEKAGPHRYQISAEGLAAIRDYVEKERGIDDAVLQSPALFLPASNNGNSKERLSVVSVDEIWKECARVAGVEEKTQHSARHAMGRHLIEKTGNIAAVQRQFDHKNAAYSMQYSRITENEINEVLNRSTEDWYKE
ncbi:MAG: tyrosine-type recombinase/integrase [Blastocatellales bacterium]|nr:tyrosine-type recombinase/integrase [Blastocatellales bacterium]